MTSRASRRAQRGSARSRRTPVRPQGSRGTNIPWVPIAVVAGILLVGVGVVYLIIQSNQEGGGGNEEAQAIENNDPAYDGPGEWVDLPTIWAEGDVKAHYGEDGGVESPNTNAHVTRDVDYTDGGLPPTGGPHWGSGTCGTDPGDASAFCGPVPWGIYREPWQPEALVHNMEHGGVIVWYNSTDPTVRERLEEWVGEEDTQLLVLTPYPELDDETVALTAWARRDVFPVNELTEDRVKDFIDELTCRFDPEGICGG